MKIEKKTEKRDVLQETERNYQKLWKEERFFESDAPSCLEYAPSSISPEELRNKVPKFFGTMAYPYVNGSPHLGHAFTVSKVEFASRVARMLGKRVLYPQGFHATGMPIKACADKLAREIDMFGDNFERYSNEDELEAGVSIATQISVQEAGTKFSNTKKGKAALKTLDKKYQFQIMMGLGIPRTEIRKFADARYWLHYFPQLWKQHLTDMGCAIDWRRSFVTTDENPYYDSFVRWQVTRLKDIGKIRFGKRYTVYSPKDGQPCLDHDRSEGEAVPVQEYIVIKCQVKQWSEDAERALGTQLPEDARVYLVPATLRPETMYGQTNLFVSPHLTYGIYHIGGSEYFLMTSRAARNMAYQGIFPNLGEYHKVADLQGAHIVGTLVSAPLSRREDVYVVPMSSIKEMKGTGIVTSVPSDSPDDYAMTEELSRKSSRHNIKPEWVSLDILPIIETPNFGNLIAPTLVKQMKINSPRDSTKLAEAKEQAYKVGFYQGRMIFGEFAGKPVQEVKPLIREKLLNSGEAVVYCEPDGLVISRSGDECVAAYVDQWYLTYGESDVAWQGDVFDHVSGKDGQNFNSFSSSTNNAIEKTLGWMIEWCVTRQYGLGTKLPWDETQLVEGLSDSTIYTAYYTVAHYLHSDIYGNNPGLGNIKPSQMTSGVWDYVFALTDKVDSDIDQSTLESMRREFTYWYPLDVRISGKDLIHNHLIFFLYIHQAIWGSTAPQYLPKGIRLNGHLTMNGEKMSKSTGNFLTLEEAIKKFGADATRLALADGSDGVEDSNFEEPVANAFVLKLYELRKWIEDMIRNAVIVGDANEYRLIRGKGGVKSLDVVQRSGERSFWDELFDNQVNTLVHETVKHFKDTNYKMALKTGFYDLTAARDTYRVSTSAASVGMHRDCIRRYAEIQAQMLSVFAPHWGDYIWREVMEQPSTIQNVVFPNPPEPVVSLALISAYIQSTSTAVSSADAAQQKRMAKGKALQYDPNKDKRLTVFVAKNWPGWQEKYIAIVGELFDGLTLDMSEISKSGEKSEMKNAMPFIQTLKRRLEAGEPKEAVLSRKLAFDEVNVVLQIAPTLLATISKLTEVRVVVVEGDNTALRVDQGKEEPIESLSPVASSAQPGSPSFAFENV